MPFRAAPPRLLLGAVLGHWSGRPLLVYFAAVVVPTVIILGLGIATVRRQNDALEALRLTTRALQQARIAEDLDRAMLDAAAAAFRDSTFGKVVEQLSSQNPSEVDGARRQIDGFRSRHPVVRDVFVVVGGTISYPRVDAPLLRTLDDVVNSEAPDVRGAVRDLLARAQDLEASDAVAATKAYQTAMALARTPGAQALAFAGAARAHAQAGDRAAAAEAWRSVIRRFSDIYSPSGRPYGLIAAVELSAVATPNDEEVVRMRDALLAGRWAVTPDQAQYFYSRLVPGRSAFDSLH